MQVKTKKNKVILFQLPPAMVGQPSPAMSVLKQYLTNEGFNVDIIYLNLKFAELQGKFLWRDPLSLAGDEIKSLMLFFNYLAIRKKDKKAYNYVLGHLMFLKPQYIGLNFDKLHTHMEYHADALEQLIDEVISETDTPEVIYYGMSTHLYQWVCATIMGEKIKLINKEAKVVVGGIGNKNTAVAFLENFDQFDYALWGEGEVPLSVLTKELSVQGENYGNFLNTAYRLENEIKISSGKNKYVYISDIKLKPDYSDYFTQKKLYKIFDEMKCSVPIEGGRGCHWQRCHFCYLNTGYRFRVKEVSTLEEEIRYAIEEYNPAYFSFLDNDVIGNDFRRFDELLDKLIEIKEDYPDFTIIVAEIITKGINSSLIRKMALAGFSAVQIGYESPSQSLLTKINKKNSFGSNFLFIKYAAIYKIALNGVNIIMGLLEETHSDIIEAIKNLHVLRFCFSAGEFRHNISSLGVMHSSPYYKKIKDQLPGWRPSPLMEFAPENFLKKGDPEYNIIDASVNKVSILWDNFREVEKHYLENSYEYKLFRKKNSLVYRECLNKEIINELEIQETSLEWYILKKGNDCVTSLHEIINELNVVFGREFLHVEIFNALDELREARLLYATDDYSEIVTIINTDIIL